MKSHGYEEQGVPPLSPAFDVVVEGRGFETDISAETVHYKVPYLRYLPNVMIQSEV